MQKEYIIGRDLFIFFSVGFSKIVKDISKTDEILILPNYFTLIAQMEKTCSKVDIIISLNHFD